MKSQPHPSIAWLSSASLHLVTLGVASLWLAPRAEWDISVKRGQPITLTLWMPAAAEPETQTATVEVAQDTPVEPMPLDVPPQPTRRQPTAPHVDPHAESPPEEIQPNAAPRPVKAIQAAVVELSPDPPAAMRKAETTRTTRVATAAAPWQASAEVGADVDEQPVPLPTNFPPVYPSDALLQGREGRVLLQVEISQEGTVRNVAVQTSSGFAMLDEAALAAVRNWRFSPARRNRINVAHTVLVPVNFAIRRR